MVVYEALPTEQGHIEVLAKNMRQADIDEVWAVQHLTPYEALDKSFCASRNTTFTITADGKVQCIFGTVPVSLLGTIGVPWLLGAATITEHTTPLLRASRRYIREVRKEYSLLMNFVDARNLLSMRWLRWMGFTIWESIPYGVDRLPFHRFEMEGTG